MTITIPVPGSVVYGQGNPRPFPIGTVITLTEELDSTEPQLDNNRQWDASEFVVSGVSTKNSVTLTIGADTQFIDLYNTLIEKKSPSVSIGNFVWLGTNKDGLQSDGEPGIENVTLSISRSDNAPVKNADGTDRPKTELTTTTNDAGQYSFDNLQALPAGVHYVVTVKAPADLAPTKIAADSQAQGLDSSNDSSKDSATSTDLTKDGQKDATLDFGFVNARVSVGDFVWFDTNKNGKQDEGEPGIEGVTLAISRTDGQPVHYVNDLGKADAVSVQPIATKAYGSYLFENLPVLTDAERYTVEITRFPHDLTPTIPQAHGTSVDDESSRIVVETAKPLVADGREDRTLDFGFVKAIVSVGNFVWLDTDKDGKQDDDKPGIGGVELTLTGPDGKYSFENLPVLEKGQKYTVTVSKAPVGFVATAAKATGEISNDSSTATVSSTDLLKHGDKDRTLDFGFVKAKETLKGKGSKVAMTGTNAAMVGALAALIVLAGAAALVAHRRMTH